MTDRDDNMLREHVERLAASIEAEATARELLESHAGTWWGDTDAATDVADGLDDLERMFDDALEIRVEGYRTGFDSEWTPERVRICVGLGGPNLFVVYDGERAWIDGYWGGSRVEGYPISLPDAVQHIASACDYMLENV